MELEQQGVEAAPNTQTPIDVYFSPDDSVLNAIVRLLNSTQQSIYFLAHSFTKQRRKAPCFSGGHTPQLRWVQV